LTDEDRIKARIRGILKQADNENDEQSREAYAAVILAALRKEAKAKWIAVGVAVLLSLTTYTLVLLISGHLRL
jgi:hypothetical protein